MLTEKEFDVLLRRARGESQAAIAKALKITQAAVSQFENNARKKIISANDLLETLKQEKITITKGLSGSRVVFGGKK